MHYCMNNMKHETIHYSFPDHCPYPSSPPPSPSANLTIFRLSTTIYYPVIYYFCIYWFIPATLQGACCKQTENNIVYCTRQIKAHHPLANKGTDDFKEKIQHIFGSIKNLRWYCYIRCCELILNVIGAFLTQTRWEDFSSYTVKKPSNFQMALRRIPQ